MRRIGIFVALIALSCGTSVASVHATDAAVPPPLTDAVEHTSVQTLAVEPSSTSGSASLGASDSAVVDPFQMLGASWSGAADTLTARVRTAAGWGEWFALEQSADTPDQGTAERRAYASRPKTSEPVFVGDAFDFELQAPAGATDLHVHLVEAGPEEADTQYQAATYLPGGAPPVLPRSAWGARPAVDAPSYSPSLKMAFVHHTAGTNNYSPEQVPGILRSIQAFEIDAQGYNDLAYNFLVDRFGRIWEGRGGGIDRNVLSAATGGFNRSSVSIAVIGDFTASTVPQAAVDSVAQVAGWKLGVNGVSPVGIASMTSAGNERYGAGTVVNFNAVSGHLDAKPTACPGGFLYNRLGEIRDKANNTAAVLANSPFGSVDLVRQTPQGLHVAGWTIEPNAGSSAVQVDVWIDGQPQSFLAGGRRPDVGNAFPAYGPNHGFDAYLAIGPGWHNACFYALNSGAGRITQLTCRDLYIYDWPFAYIDSASVHPDGVHLTGWALDPNSSGSIEVHVYVDGVGYARRTTVNRPDLAGPFPENGTVHGFDIVVPAPFRDVCLFAINVGSGANVVIGCPATGSNPGGSVDAMAYAPEGVRATGWTIDPNTASPNAVALSVDGRIVATADAGQSRPDIAALFSEYGGRHGFSVGGATGPGTRQVCVFGMNTGPGVSTPLRCSMMTFTDDPIGYLDFVTPASGGRRAVGWALDPNSGSPIQIHLHVWTASGVQLVIGEADRSRADIGAAYPFFGSAHGFDVAIPPGGQVCAYGINAGAGTHRLLGCIG